MAGRVMDDAATTAAAIQSKAVRRAAERQTRDMDRRENAELLDRASALPSTTTQTCSDGATT